jgi:hypothetical protein
MIRGTFFYRMKSRQCDSRTSSQPGISICRHQPAGIRRSEVANFARNENYSVVSHALSRLFRRFDCPAFLLTAEETGQTNRRIETEPIRRRTQRAFLKSRDSTKMFRRSDFRNARSVRKE